MVDASKYFHFQIRFCEFVDEQYSRANTNFTKIYLFREWEGQHNAVLYPLRRQKQACPGPKELVRNSRNIYKTSK